MAHYVNIALIHLLNVNQLNEVYYKKSLLWYFTFPFNRKISCFVMLRANVFKVTFRWMNSCMFLNVRLKLFVKNEKNLTKIFNKLYQNFAVSLTYIPFCCWHRDIYNKSLKKNITFLMLIGILLILQNQF